MPEAFAPADAVQIERAARGGLLAGNRKIGGLLGLGVVLLLIAIAAAIMTMFRVVEDTRLVEHTLIVEATTYRAAAYNEQIETGRRGFLLSGSDRFRGTVRIASANLRTELDRLQELVVDNPDQQQRATHIVALHTERDALLERELAPGADRQAEGVAENLDTDRAVLITREIRTLAAEMIEIEGELLLERNDAQFSGLVSLYIFGGVALALLIGVLITVIAMILRYNRSLHTAQDLLRSANEGLESAVAQRTAELQRANQEIQRFAYIVSHDLRSPLVNVLGFTSELDEARKIILRYYSGIAEKNPDLTDEQVRLAVEEDLPEALGFIRSSTEKMDRLINSILQLSRQGRRPLTPELLDMDKLVAGVVASLHQTALDAGATVTVGSLPAVESDRVSVEQIISNMVENAIKYLSPARAGEIRIEGRRSGSTVQVDVIDNGRGIAAHDHERIFELFRRSGMQDQPGEGIGLANVRALAYRLGGLIEVQSELDRGSRFRLSLPAKFIATEQTDE